MNYKKDEFDKVVDQDIEKGYEYWPVTMNNTYNFKNINNKHSYYHYIYLKYFWTMFITVNH